jgi:hypothetical protein
MVNPEKESEEKNDSLLMTDWLVIYEKIKPLSRDSPR